MYFDYKYHYIFKELKKKLLSVFKREDIRNIISCHFKSCQNCIIMIITDS